MWRSHDGLLSSSRGRDTAPCHRWSACPDPRRARAERVPCWPSSGLRPRSGRRHAPCRRARHGPARARGLPPGARTRGARRRRRCAGAPLDCLRLAPRDADIQMALAEALQRVGALDAAIEAWRAAHAARPEDRRAARGLVLALVAAGRSPEAVTLARAAVEPPREGPDALFTLGLAQSEQDVDAALRVLHTRARARSAPHAGPLQPRAAPQATRPAG